jgi:hypothetical protein
LPVSRLPRCTGGRQGRHALHQQVVAAAHLVLLVGRPEEARASLPDGPEQVDQVERALLARLGAVLDDVGRLEQLPELRRAAAGDGGLDPLRDRRRVERAPARRGPRVERRVPGVDVVALERLPHGLEVARRLPGRVRLAVEVEQRLGAAGLRRHHVVEREPQLVRELPDGRVRLVDQLPAVLRELPVEEGGVAARPAAAAQAVAGLEDVGHDPALPQAEGAGEAGQPRADDGHGGRDAPGPVGARRGGRPRAGRRRLGAGGGAQPHRGGGAGEEGAAVEKEGVHGDAGVVGPVDDLREGDQAAEQGGVRHGRPR